ncbi:hypothetical protein AB0H00_14360 [Nocardia sp. NPDC023852]|uniref:hypothetical protein n=1 Tax=Nocardia sp. NPDC023852 TaxID=3154697 RepID=UPI00340500E5
MIGIEQGRLRFGPRGITRRALAWRDLADDGRYVITRGTPRSRHRPTPTACPQRSTPNSPQ